MEPGCEACIEPLNHPPCVRDKRLWPRGIYDHETNGNRQTSHLSRARARSRASAVPKAAIRIMWSGPAVHGGASRGPGASPLQNSRPPGTSQDPGEITAITAALNAGIPFRDVQDFAGHADPPPPAATTAPGTTST